MAIAIYRSTPERFDANTLISPHRSRREHFLGLQWVQRQTGIIKSKVTLYPLLHGVSTGDGLHNLCSPSTHLQPGQLRAALGTCPKQAYARAVARHPRAQEKVLALKNHTPTWTWFCLAWEGCQGHRCHESHQACYQPSAAQHLKPYHCSPSKATRFTPPLFLPLADELP